MSHYLDNFDVTGVEGKASKPNLSVGLTENVVVAYIKGEPNPNSPGNFIVNVGIVQLDDPAAPNVFNEKDATEYRFYITEKAMLSTMNKLRHIFNVVNPTEAVKFQAFWKKSLETGGVDDNGVPQAVITFCRYLHKYCVGRTPSRVKVSGELDQTGTRVFGRLTLIPFLEPMSGPAELKFDPAKDSAEPKKAAQGGPVMPGASPSAGIPSMGAIPSLGGLPDQAPAMLGSLPTINSEQGVDDLPF